MPEIKFRIENTLKTKEIIGFEINKCEDITLK